MALFENEDRNQPPSPRRIREARRAGYVPRSRELTHSLALCCITVGLVLVGPGLWRAAGAMLRSALETAGPSADLVSSEVWSRGMELTGLAAAWMLGVLAAVIGGQIAVFGFHVTPASLKPHWQWLGLRSGVARLMANAGIVAIGQLLLRLALIGIVGVVVLRQEFRWWTAAETRTPDELVRHATEAGVRAAAAVSVVLVVMGIWDFFESRRRYVRSLRMTTAEAREEAKLSGSSRRGRRRTIRPTIAARSRPGAEHAAEHAVHQGPQGGRKELARDSGR